MTKKSFKRLLSLFLILTLLITGTIWPDTEEVEAASRSSVVLNLSDASILITDTYYQVGATKYNGSYDYVIQGTYSGPDYDSTNLLSSIINVQDFSGNITMSNTTIDRNGCSMITFYDGCNCTLTLSGTNNWDNNYQASSGIITDKAGASLQVTGNAKVRVIGSGVLNSKSHAAVAVGVGCNRTFTGTLDLAGGTFNLASGTNAAGTSVLGVTPIGVSSGASSSGTFIFSGATINIPTVKSGHPAIGYAQVNESDVPAACSSTIRITGGTLNIVPGSKATAIGAATNTNAPNIYISGGNLNIPITTTNTTAIGGAGGSGGLGVSTTSHAGVISISGGNIDISTTSKAPLIGDQLYATSPSTITITGGKVVLTKGSSSSSGVFFGGKVVTSGYTNMHLSVGKDVDTTADILYSTYSASSYWSDLPVTNGYCYIYPCTTETHNYIYSPKSGDDSSHSSVCKWCNHKAMNAKHTFHYIAEGNVLYEECSLCKFRNSMELPVINPVPYAAKQYSVVPILHNFQSRDYIVEYGLNGANYTTTAPSTVGKYKVRVTCGGASIIGDLEIYQADGWDFRASNCTSVYDGAKHTGAVSVSAPAGCTIKYGTNSAVFNLNDAPEYTNVGDYTYWVKLSKDNFIDVIFPITVSITPKYIEGVLIQGVDNPYGNNNFDTQAMCTTEGISTSTVDIIWVKDNTVQSGKAKFNTTYDAQITLYPNSTGYRFKSSISKTNCTINSTIADSMQLNGDGSITVHKSFTAPKAKLLSVEVIKPITDLPYGVEYSVAGLNLPAVTPITTEDSTVTYAEITWDLSTQILGTYDPVTPYAQTFTLGGVLQLPSSVDPDVVNTNVKCQISILSDTVKDVEVTPAPGIYADDQSITLISGTPDAEIYYTLDGTTPSNTSTRYTAPISLTGVEGLKKNYTIKAIAYKTGMYTSNVTSYDYNINRVDITPPEVSIMIDSNIWSTILSAVTFKHFSLDDKKVTITYTDNSDDIAKKLYYISDTELTEAQLSRVEWCDYTEPFWISPRGKYIIYAKCVDAYDNSTVVNSDGYVLYVNATSNTARISAVPNVTDYVSFFVNCNGNTIDTVSIDSLLLDTDYYEAISSSGIITLLPPAFDRLDYGQHTITVTYKPQDEEYVNAPGNTAPSSTVCMLNINKARLLYIEDPEPLLDVPNGLTLETIGTMLPTAVGAITDDVSITSLPVVWDLSSLASGSYDQTSLDAATFELRGTVQLPSDLVQNDVPLDVLITVCVNKAGTCLRPQTNITPGRYDHELSVILSSPDDATIYYTLDGTTPSLSSTSYTEAITVSENTTIKAFCHKAGMSDSMMAIYSYNIYQSDSTAPTGSITIGETDPWVEFFNTITFNWFTSEQQKVTITASDDESGVKAIFYHISDVALSTEDLAKVNNWELYQEPFYLSKQSSNVVYAKLINGDDKASYINSDGVVVYAESEPISETITYIKGSSIDAYAVFKFNGNTVSNVKLNNNVLVAGTDYVVSNSGKITMLSSFTEKLNTGKYVVNVSFKPLGKDTVSANDISTLPKDKTFVLMISTTSETPKPNTGSGSSSSGSGSSSSGGSSSGSSGSSGSVVTKPTAKPDNNKTNVTETSDKDGGKTTTTTSEDGQGNKIVNVEHTDAKGNKTVSTTESYNGTVIKETSSVVNVDGTSLLTEKKRDSAGYTTERVVKVANDITTERVIINNASGFNETFTSDVTVDDSIVNVDIKTTNSNGYVTSTARCTAPSIDERTYGNITIKTINGTSVAVANTTYTLPNGKFKISPEHVKTILKFANAANNLPTDVKPSVTPLVSNVDIIERVVNSDNVPKYTLKYNSADITAGNKLYIWKNVSGKHVALSSPSVTVKADGTLSFTKTANATYDLVNKKFNTKFNNAMLKNTKLAKTYAAVKVGKTTKVSLKDTCDTTSIKSIKYSSSKSKVAAVNKSGKVTCKKKGTTKIKIKVTYNNGKTKTLTETVKVK